MTAGIRAGGQCAKSPSTGLCLSHCDDSLIAFSKEAIPFGIKLYLQKVEHLYSPFQKASSGHVHLLQQNNRVPCSSTQFISVYSFLDCRPSDA